MFSVQGFGSELLDAGSAVWTNFSCASEDFG